MHRYNHRNTLTNIHFAFKESHKEQVAEAQINNMSIKDFKVLCPVCRWNFSRCIHRSNSFINIFYRECISEQHYNLSELLNSNPPRAEMSDLPKNSITEDIKMLQRKMQKLFDMYRTGKLLLCKNLWRKR